MLLKGQITERNKERGFGYLDSEGKRIFLHWRDFKERRHELQLGDVILFTLGTDKQGRSCAKEAIHARSISPTAGGHLRGRHWLFLMVLLALPAYAVATTFSAKIAGYVALWCLLISWCTDMMYSWDKRKARNKEWREPEHILHFMELIGGWPGAFIAQRRFRHKSSKGPYQFVFVLIVGLYQFLAIDALRGGPFFGLIVHAIDKALS